MKNKINGAGAKPAPLTNKQKQDKRKAELQAAAVRDGFRNWSEALTAWKNGQYNLVVAIRNKPDEYKNKI